MVSDLSRYFCVNLDSVHFHVPPEKLFGGEYGSVAENQLEAELDELEAQRGRIMEANFKWRQAQMMLEYACKQLAVAVQKWQDLPTIPTM